MTPAGNHRPLSSPWPDDLTRAMAVLPRDGRVWIALSGGLDSVVLTHAVRAWADERPGLGVRAIHVNHQLQPAAPDMESLCRRLCARLGIALCVRHVRVTDSGGGLESEARQVRYRVFESFMSDGDTLLMAHHQDDQAETALFRMVRGSGGPGPAGMPSCRPLGRGRLQRPFMAITRSTLRQWGASRGLNWVDDPSNSDTDFDRNFLRHEVLPLLEQRWPGVKSNLARLAARTSEVETLLGRLGSIQRACVEDAWGRLSTEALARLPRPEQKNLLRWWIIDQGAAPPSPGQLDQGLSDVMTAADDRQPWLVGSGYTVRRFRGWLYWVIDRPGTPDQPVQWQTHRVLPWGAGQLRFEPGPDREFPVLTVRRREPGERFRPRPDGPSRPVKKWLQEQTVPPWERAALPFVEREGTLVAIGDLWQSTEALGRVSGGGWRIVWDRSCR